MATSTSATRLRRRAIPAATPREALTRRAASGRIRRGTAIAIAASLFWVPAAAGAASGKVRLTNLADVSFGTLADVTSDAVQSQSLCVYANSPTNSYNVTALGTGPGGSFQLSSGPTAMSYEVQWSDSSGRSSGVQLDPNVPLTGQASAANHQTCSTGPASTASLIVVLRSAALSNATAGTYSGSLTLVVGAE